MNDDVAGLVERLEGRASWDKDEIKLEAASTIRALVAEIERLRDKRDEMSVEAARLFELHRQAEAKLREAVELMRTVDAMIFNDNGDVTYSPLQIRSAIRAFLAAMEKQDGQG